MIRIIATVLFCCWGLVTIAQNKNPKFVWPEGKKMAISLSFDDARTTNIRQGTDLFDKYGVKATFYVLPNRVEPDLELWKKAVANGHEMGNHSVAHPCTGNFIFARGNPLESYTIERMRNELLEANKLIEKLLGVTPTTYAYPCGLTTIGRGKNAQSFVPVISDLFVAGRGWLDEAPVDPTYCDMAQITGVSMDDKEFSQLLPMIKQAEKDAQWLVLAGHETSEVHGGQTSRLTMLEELIKYAKDPKNGVWIATVGEIAAYVKEQRDKGLVNTPQTIFANAGKEIVLPAQFGTAKGKDIAYMPEWKAFGWFTGKDEVSWDIDAPQNGNYTVYLDWSVSDEDSGKSYVLEGGTIPLKGKVDKSGSWETFKEKKIGQIQLKKGRQKLTFKPEIEFEKGAILDLRMIRLVPIK